MSGKAEIIFHGDDAVTINHFDGTTERAVIAEFDVDGRDLMDDIILTDGRRFVRVDEGDVSGAYTGVGSTWEQTSEAPPWHVASKKKDMATMDLNDLRRREADLLKAMAKATMAEQTQLMADLAEVRSLRQAAIRGEAETDLANAVVRASLQPVFAHSTRTSSALDWLADVPTSGEDYDQAMAVEANLWFQRLDPAVKADATEYAIQAQGVAMVHAGRYGEQSEAARRAFLDQADHLRRSAGFDKVASRSLSEIAAEIRADWKNPYLGAIPYLDAMSQLDSITDYYGADDAAGIVSYFLTNSRNWRGETAKRIKAELKAMLKGRYGSRTAAYREPHPRRLGEGICNGEFEYNVSRMGGTPSMRCTECGFVIVDTDGYEDYEDYVEASRTARLGTTASADPGADHDPVIELLASGQAQTYQQAVAMVEAAQRTAEVVDPWQESLDEGHTADPAAANIPVDVDATDHDGGDWPNEQGKKDTTPVGSRKTAATAWVTYPGDDATRDRIVQQVLDAGGHITSSRWAGTWLFEVSAADPVSMAALERAVGLDLNRSDPPGTRGYARDRRLAASGGFYVKRSRGPRPGYGPNDPPRSGWTGPIKSEEQANKERQAWEESGWTAEVVPRTPEVDAEVKAWERSVKERRSSLVADPRRLNAFRARVSSGGSRGRHPSGDRAARQAVTPDEGAFHRTAADFAIPSGVGARTFSPDQTLAQIGNMNVMAISGGRVNIIRKGNGEPVGISLPVSNGYAVNVFLADDDTYIVQRVFRGVVKGEVRDVYMDELGEMAYQAGMFRSFDFGAHKIGSRHKAKKPPQMRRKTEESDPGPRLKRKRKRDDDEELDDKGDPAPKVKRDDSGRFATRRTKTAMPNPVDLGIKVGDIFETSWGYDQTNVNFYEVVGLTGASVKIRPIEKRIVQGNGPGGNQVVPVPGAYHDRDVLIGHGKAEVTKRIQTGYRGAPGFSLEHSWASKWDGQPVYETDSMFGH